VKSTGIHTYLGGMQLGVARVFDDQGSVETWLPGIRARKRVGLTHRRIEDAPVVDLVYANPPCTRFSMTGTDMFVAEDRSSLSRFECLQECVHYALACKASMFWWETGPLAYTKGISLATEVAQVFGARTMWVLRIDANDFGVPQKRVRTHFLYFKDRVGPPPLQATPKLAHLDQSKYLRSWLENANCEPSPPAGYGPEYLKSFGTYTVENFVAVQNSLLRQRKAWTPKLIPIDAEYSPAVIARAMGFPDRWLTVSENAALMGLPFWDCDDKWEESVRLMSKGVCVGVAEGVARAALNAVSLPNARLHGQGLLIHRLGQLGHPPSTELVVNA